jgi:hypothetical protein
MGDNLPGQIWSRVNDRLNGNQGGHGHARETVHPQEILQHLDAGPVTRQFLTGADDFFDYM